MVPEPKFLEQGLLAERLAVQRAAGRRIVLANGAFDLLHAGHVRFLAAARAEGDALVVALNADASVAAAKGAGRPLQPLAERAEVVAALAAVDYVVAFDEATVDGLLERLRPDVHAKGKDYDGATLPERETNLRLGIRMAFVGDEKERGSTLLAAKLAAQGTERPDRMTRIAIEDAAGFVQCRRREALQAGGWLDFRRWVEGKPGVFVEGGSARFVRRVELPVGVVYAKVVRPLERKRSPLLEMHHALALRSVGFGAPEPWLALEGRLDGTPAGVLVSGEVAGPSLFDRLRGGRMSAAERRLRANDLGRAVRALHGARFFPPDLHAWHWKLVGPAGLGARSLVLLDVMRLERGGATLPRRRAARGLLALELSAGGAATKYDRLRVLRAWLGGSLAHARPWLRLFARLRPALAGRSTFLPPTGGT